MIPAEQIAELKTKHPQLWAQKRAVLTEQQSAQVILAQLAHDAANPPHLEQVARVKNLILALNLKQTQTAGLRQAAEQALAELGEHAPLVGVSLNASPETERIKELEAELKASLAALEAAAAKKKAK
jgi:hypothetical protein